MKITRLNEVEVVDLGAGDVETIAVVTAPPLPEPLSADWLQDARQAVQGERDKHAAVVAKTESIDASLTALRAELVDAETSLKAAESPDLTGDIEVDLATIELQATHGAALSGRVAMLRRKIPMVETLLSQMKAQEQPARLDIREAVETLWAEYAEKMDIADALTTLHEYHAAVQAAGLGHRWQTNVLSELNRDKPVAAARQRLTALLAIPGVEVERDEVEPIAPCTLSEHDRNFALEPQVGGDFKPTIARLAPAETESIDPSGDYLMNQTREIYAARKAA